MGATRWQLRADSGQSLHPHRTRADAAANETRCAKRSGQQHANAWERLHDVITEDAETVPVGTQGQHRPRHSIDGIDVAPQVVLVDACAHRHTSAERAQHDQHAMYYFRC
jgi:hypothetical protein